MQETMEVPALQAEEALLGSVLLDSAMFAQVEPLLTQADFSNSGGRRIWMAMGDVVNGGGAIDVVTIAARLEELGQLGSVGGRARLGDMAAAVPTATHAVYYAEIVKKRSTMRKLKAALETATDRVGSAHDVGVAMEHLNTLITEATLLQPERGAKSVHEMLNPLLDDIAERKDKPVGVPTGIIDLDRVTGGLRAPDLVIVGARPGAGKSAACFSFAHHAALQGHRVAIFSLEMSSTQVLERLIAIEGSVNVAHLRNGMLSEDEWGRTIQACGRLDECDIYIDDSEPMTIADIRAQARRLNAQKPLDLVIVDYVQLVRGGEGNDGVRHQEVARIARELKGLARELHVPVLTPAQVNRAVDTRADHQLVLSDLRESGDLENSADIVMFIHREAMYDPACEDPNGAVFQIRKHRSGENPVDIPVYFNAQNTRFLPLARLSVVNHDEEEWAS